MDRFMLDTNVFNALLDGTIKFEAVEGKMIFVTHNQDDELRATKNPERRDQLLKTVTVVAPQKLSTSSSAWDITPWDEGEWGSNDGIFENLHRRLIALDKIAGKGRNYGNQMRDALIAETAIRNELILVTDDVNLKQATQELNGYVIDVVAFSTR